MLSSKTLDLDKTSKSYKNCSIRDLGLPNVKCRTQYMYIDQDNQKIVLGIEKSNGLSALVEIEDIHPSP